MIDVSGLHHRYGPLTAVEDLSFHVARGEVLGLLGPNGAGKSTAMRSIVGLLSPTRGEIRVGGHDMATASRDARRQLGYLPENVPLYRELTVQEFLRYASLAKGVPRRLVAGEIDRVVEACGLELVVHRLIGYCSRGYRQRVGLAQALAGDPPALVLDEPTVGLDPAQMVEIRQRIAALARDRAVLLSTHVLPEASLLCSRVLILNLGKRLAEDTPDNLASALSDAPRLLVSVSARTASRADVLSTLPFVAGCERVKDDGPRARWRVELATGDDTPRLVEALVRAGCAIEEVRPDRLDLEDVYLKLVRDETSTGAPGHGRAGNVGAASAAGEHAGP